jgi:hypothetical protein
MQQESERYTFHLKSGREVWKQAERVASAGQEQNVTMTVFIDITDKRIM